MDLGGYGKFRKRQTVSYGSEPRIPVRRLCRTYGSDGLRGWRHGIRRAHKVTIDLRISYRNQCTGTIPTPPAVKSSLPQNLPCLPTPDAKRSAPARVSPDWIVAIPWRYSLLSASSSASVQPSYADIRSERMHRCGKPAICLAS